jgi:hypothetical protein
MGWKQITTFTVAVPLLVMVAFLFEHYVHIPAKLNTDSGRT